MTDIFIKRGDSTKVAAYTGKAGELVMDTTNKTIHVMDGSTAGGTKLAKSSDIPTKTSQLTNDSGYLTSIPATVATGSEVGSIELKPLTTSTHGGFIDFHWKGSSADFTSRILEKAQSSLYITASNGVYINDSKAATATDIASCYKVSGGALNNGAVISRATSGTSWINGRNVAIVKNTTAPGSSWGAITSSKSTSGSWETGVLGDNHYIVYASDTNYNAGTNSVTNGIVINNNGNVSVGGSSLTVGGSAVATTSAVNAKISMSGSRGTLAGYETATAGTTVSATSSDAQTGSKITISNGTSGTSWTKIVGLSANATVTLGSSWSWSGGEAPDLTSAGILVCCWASTIGICSFVSGS